MTCRSAACLAVLLELTVVAHGEDGQANADQNAERIAENHLAAIAACRAFVEAEDQYRRTDWDKDGLLEYSTALRGDHSLFETKGDAGDLKLINQAFAFAEVRHVPAKDQALPEPTEAERAEMAKHLKALADDDVDTREAGAKALEAMGTKALAGIEKEAAKNADAEVRRHCTEIARHLNSTMVLKMDLDFTAAQPKAGYYFAVLTRQGAHATGGAKTYFRPNKQGRFSSPSSMTEGYALLAFPADYGRTGLHTYQVNIEGVVYDKDLGKDTLELVKTMDEYNPDNTWKVVD
ncbi:MAG: DUF2950 domain-containing protein [Planctomycetes bacterium]|nr:DUF2950 domain-containing protein [Planctomycetota bacterium]